MMGKQLWIPFLVAIACVAVSGPARAAAAQGLVASETKVTLSGTSDWGATHVMRGSFDGPLGHGTYSGKLALSTVHYVTPTCGPACADVSGRITFSTKRGDFTVAAQPGGPVALEDIRTHSLRHFRLALRVVGGTRAYAHANGRLTLTYSSVWTHQTVGGVVVDTIEDSGTLTGRLRP
jgi:hypothetical protein